MLGPEKKQGEVLCNINVVRQGCHLTSETESKFGLDSLISIKVATLIRRVNSAVCATVGAVLSHEVFTNGFDWPHKLQDNCDYKWAVVMTIFIAVAFRRPR